MGKVTDAMILALIEGLHGPGWPWGWSKPRQQKRMDEYRMALCLVERARALGVRASDGAVESAVAVFADAGVHPGHALIAKALEAAGGGAL